MFITILVAFERAFRVTLFGGTIQISILMSGIALAEKGQDECPLLLFQVILTDRSNDRLRENENGGPEEIML